MKKIIFLFFLITLFFLSHSFSYAGAPPTATSCPVCPSGFIWNNAYNTCQDSKNPTNYQNPTKRVDCSASGSCCTNAIDGTCSATGYCSSNPQPQPAENVYNCANRDPRCPALTYPTCTNFPYSINWSCQSPNCSMQNTSGNDSTQWTKSCAYSKVQPPPAYCRPENDKNCTGTTGSQGDCCANLICQAPGANHSALGDGTCVKAPSSLGQTCSTCLPGDIWNTAKNSCVGLNGNISNPVSSVYCNLTRQTCVQGQGCVETTTNNSTPAAPPCASRNSDGKCFYVNTGLNIPIGTNPQSLIQTLFGLILSISGGIALLLIIISGYRILTSQGNPEAVKGAREQLTAAIVGLLFIIFALVILQVIGYDILRIPAFK